MSSKPNSKLNFKSPTSSAKTNNVLETNLTKKEIKNNSKVCGASIYQQQKKSLEDNINKILTIASKDKEKKEEDTFEQNKDFEEKSDNRKKVYKLSLKSEEGEFEDLSNNKYKLSNIITPTSGKSKKISSLKPLFLSSKTETRNSSKTTSNNNTTPTNKVNANKELISSKISSRKVDLMSIATETDSTQISPINNNTQTGNNTSKFKIRNPKKNIKSLNYSSMNTSSTNSNFSNSKTPSSQQSNLNNKGQVIGFEKKIKEPVSTKNADSKPFRALFNSFEISKEAMTLESDGNNSYDYFKNFYSQIINEKKMEAEAELVEDKGCLLEETDVPKTKDVNEYYQESSAINQKSNIINNYKDSKFFLGTKHIQNNFNHGTPTNICGRINNYISFKSNICKNFKTNANKEILRKMNNTSNKDKKEDSSKEKSLEAISYRNEKEGNKQETNTGSIVKKSIRKSTKGKSTLNAPCLIEKSYNKVRAKSKVQKDKMKVKTLQNYSTISNTINNNNSENLGNISATPKNANIKTKKLSTTVYKPISKIVKSKESEIKEIEKSNLISFRDKQK